MIRNFDWHIAMAVAVTAGIASAASAQIGSTFDTDDQGWGTLNDARLFQWTDDLGNPPGAIRATDASDGRIWYFAASNAYLGNMGSYYSGSLSWDIRGIQGNQTSIPGRADVMLVGAGLQLGINLGVIPSNSEWTSWSTLLDASEDWRRIDSLANGTLLATAATEADIRVVLADLAGLYIRGEYTNGADAAALDNVWLVPAPGSLALFGFAALGMRRRR